MPEVRNVPREHAELRFLGGPPKHFFSGFGEIWYCTVLSSSPGTPKLSSMEHQSKLLRIPGIPDMGMVSHHPNGELALTLSFNSV